MAAIAIRWSGWLLVAGAALLGAAIVRLSFRPVMNQQYPPSVNVLMLISSILLILSLPAMYVKQADSAGWLGLVGFALLQTGVLFLAIISAAPLMYPSITKPPGESVVTFSLGTALACGLILTAIATLSAGVYPRWSGILLLIAAAGFFFVFFVAEFLRPVAGQLGSAFFGVLLAVAFMWIGFALWSSGSIATHSAAG